MAELNGLDDRKKKILTAIIRNYLETGEPVGSRTISKYTDMNLSSATIRNEMSDLEELGYLLQPHTSAGRIPSDQGYRFYVDAMMEEKEKQIDDRERQLDDKLEMLLEKEDKLDNQLKQVAKVLANNTNYATMISVPRVHGNKIKFIQLSRVDAEHIVAVIVVEGNLIRNNILHISEELDDETLLKLNILLNTELNGLAIEEINLGLIGEIKKQAGIHSGLISDIIDLVGEAIRPDEDIQVYTSGVTNILKYPELADKERASELLNVFEDKTEFTELIQDSMEKESETGIQVYIGNEAPVATMRDCSVVTATYDLGDGMRGTFGIIGPKRMDYEKVIGTLKTVKRQLDELYRKDGQPLGQ